MAEAIAAFYMTNHRYGRNPVKEKIFPAITMVGARPTFYLIPITKALMKAVSAGQYPPQETVVMQFIPPVQNIADYGRDGMLNLEGRRVAFQCLEGMKRLIGNEVGT